MQPALCLVLTPSRENLQRQPLPQFAILGGSFNPVHVAHVAFADCLGRLPDITQVLVIPAAQNPLKDSGTLLPVDLRRKMAHAAFAGLAKVAVLDIELRRQPPSYTLDTLHLLQGLYPEVGFQLALGWDTYVDFRKWRGSGRLLELAGLIVAPRGEPGAEPWLKAHALDPLPRDWAGRLHPTGPGTWADADGRTILRVLPVELPAVSGSAVLADRRWDLVPDAARPLLVQHAAQHLA